MKNKVRRLAASGDRTEDLIGLNANQPVVLFPSTRHSVATTQYSAGHPPKDFFNTAACVNKRHSPPAPTPEYAPNAVLGPGCPEPSLNPAEDCFD